MAPLGLGLGTIIDVIGGGSAAVAIEDYFFELSGGELQPRSSFSDYSDAWDLDGNSDIQPAASPAEEGYFDTDSNGDLQPKA